MGIDYDGVSLPERLTGAFLAAFLIVAESLELYMLFNSVDKALRSMPAVTKKCQTFNAARAGVLGAIRLFAEYLRRILQILRDFVSPATISSFQPS